MSQAVDIIAFYKFIALTDTVALRDRLFAFCDLHAIRGTILLSEEGINGTVAGSRAAIDALQAELRADARFADLQFKTSSADFIPFQRLKIRLKREIVALGVPAIDPREQVGIYVPPGEWNTLITQPDVVVIDTRNEYEYAVGSFTGAEDPHTESFRQFPDYVARRFGTGRPKVAMFCTGGIRCEKATAFMLAQGFSEVYHLKGGILNYLETVSAENSLWQGECFVFDDRRTVDHQLQPGTALTHTD